ncbi:nose resistant to fluoxetine protein 6-like [Drosophila tropicalis]|uniref:nose resistant to fluoxetine protein 6-like n=1 Tax=Drosophila tropicalis TaxID=46794 RepID=UPI0035AB9EEF
MVSTRVFLIATLLLSVGTTVWSSSQNDDYMEMDLSEYQSLTRLRHLSVEFLDFYQNITLKDLLPGESPRITPQDLECLSDLSLLTQGVRTGSWWAIRLFDSWGSIPSGILKGNLKDLGNYDECLAIDHQVTSSHSVRGKYCFAKIIHIGKISGVPNFLNVNTAVCFPSSCSGTHMDTMIRQLFKQLLNIEVSADLELVNDASCKTADKEPYDGVTIFTIVILSILATLMVLATLYDYFLCEDQKKLPVIVKAFSARANSRSLFRIVDNKSNPNVIDCLHGIRCMSLVYVIFGHDYIIAGVSPNINIVDAYKWFNSAFFMVVREGVFSVDTFFFLSGLLVVLVGLRYVEKTKGKLNVPMMYLHRYLRLTPVLAIGILIYMKILPLLGDGPLYGGVAMEDYSLCKDNWFWTLLYVQNYATNDLCIGHSWYLAVDMQLYIIAPFLILALYKWGKKGAAGVFVLMLLLASCLFSMMVIKNYSMVSGGSTSMKKIYFGTQTRASPYLIGILFGYFLHVNRGKTFKLNRPTVWLGWIVSLSLFFTCIFALYDVSTSMPIVDEAFFLTLGRIAWPLGLCWVIFACMQGYGGLANSFLSSPLWQPLSKLSYCAYIFHMLIESLNGGITRTQTYFSNYQVMLRFWGDFGFVVILAYFMYILIEAPFGNIESLLLPMRQPSPAVAPVTKVPAPITSTSESAPPLPNKSVLTDEKPSVTFTTSS